MQNQYTFLIKSVTFLYTKNELYEKEITFTIASKNKIFRNKLAQGGEILVHGKL